MTNARSYLFLILFTLFNCENKTNRNDIEAKLLSYSDIIHSEPFLGAERMNVYKENVFFTRLNDLNGKFIQVNRLKDGSKAGNLLKYGFGPNEVSNFVPQSIKIDQNELFGVTAQSQLVKINLDTIDFDNPNILIEELPVETSPINDLLYLTDSIVVGHSSSKLLEGELFSYNLFTEELLSFNSYPIMDGLIDRNKLDLYQLYYKHLISNPSKRVFCAVYSNYDLIRIFDYENNLIEEKFESHSNKPVVLSRGGGKLIDYSNATTLSLDVKADNKYIYRLGMFDVTNSELSQMGLEEMKQHKPLLTIWNWKGELIARFQLDVSIYRFDIQERKLFGITPYNDENIYIYELPIL